MLPTAQQRIRKLLEDRSREIVEVEQKYAELLKSEYLGRSLELKKIPDFWVQALRNHHTLPRLITPEDWKALSFIEDLTVDEFPSRMGNNTVKLTIEFKANPYFTNSSLWAAVSIDRSSYSCSSISFKEGFSLLSFDMSEGAHSFFRIFCKENEVDSLNNEVGFVYEIIRGIQIDLWEDPQSYYELNIGDYWSFYNDINSESFGSAKLIKNEK